MKLESLNSLQMSKFTYYKHPNSDIIIIDNFFISQIQEGATVDKLGAQSVQHIIDKHFKNRPWIYISNRVTSYAVDPLVYEHAKEHKYLKGIAIVASDLDKLRAAEFEINFSKMPITIVECMVDGIIWGKKILEQ